MSRDLLIDLLPSGDPFAPFDDAAYARLRTPIVKPASVAAPISTPPVNQPSFPVDTPPLAPPIEPPAVLPTEPIVAPIAIPPAPAEVDFSGLQSLPSSPSLKPSQTSNSTKTNQTRRRRRTGVGPATIVFAVVMFAGILGCLYLLLTDRGLTTEGDLVTLNNGPVGPDVHPAGAAAPQPEPPRGNRRSRQANPQRPAFGTPLEPWADTKKPPLAEPEPQPMAAEPDMLDGQPAPEPEPPMPQPMVPEKEPASVPDTENAAAERQALDQLAEVLHGGRFAEMNDALAAAGGQVKSEEGLRELAGDALLVELADYYLAGIRQGSARQGAGESFELSPGVTVGVVEGTEEKITLKLGRNKTYPLDQLPLVLAHRLAEFALPADSPEALCGKAVYQALWSQATAAHRRQAIDWLNQAEVVNDRFDAAEVRSAIERLFPE